MLAAQVGSLIPLQQVDIKYLSEEQVNKLTAAFQKWFDEAPKGYRKARGRAWVIYLLLRFTGARLGEVLSLSIEDIDWRNAEVKLPTLKQKRPSSRVVPVPPQVIAEMGRVLAEFPELREELFSLTPRAFRYIFSARCREANIPAELSHPHTLRHTRAIELLRAGVPVSVVQQLLGHAYLSTTAIYLRFSGVEIKTILRDRGLI